MVTLMVCWAAVSVVLGVSSMNHTGRLDCGGTLKPVALPSIVNCVPLENTSTEFKKSLVVNEPVLGCVAWNAARSRKTSLATVVVEITQALPDAVEACKLQVEGKLPTLVTVIVVEDTTALARITLPKL